MKAQTQTEHSDIETEQKRSDQNKTKHGNREVKLTAFKKTRNTRKQDKTQKNKRKKTQNQSQF